MRNRSLLGLLVLALLTLAVAAPSASADPNNNNSKKLRAAVTVGGIRAHQAALQNIADANGGTRLAGTPGYDASAAYVFQKATAAGYNVRYQEFTFLLVEDRTPPELQRISPSPDTFVNGVDFATMEYSGSGNVTAPLVAVDLDLVSPTLAVDSGCEASDFAGFPAGAIALMQRGTCTFRLKAENARAAGAAAAVIFNTGTPDRLGLVFGTLNAPLFDRPVIGMTFALGSELANGVANGPTGTTVRVRTDTLAEERTTRNVIAETQTGDQNNVVMVGAHLDSVSAGPGINDNGSGSAVILEIAEEMAKVKPRNKVRFAWWSAEESGLVGSTYYVNNLTQAERDATALYLNFDMVGSPNFVRFVYDGSGDVGPAGPAGSAQIEQVFTDYFAAQGLASEPTPFNGRSDYGPFIAPAVGIPAGGLFTGAEGIKTPDQAAVYGGTAGQQYDPCYHLLCDTFANNSNTALDQMSDAAAHAVITFAQSTTVVNGKKGKGNVKTTGKINRQAQ